LFSPDPDRPDPGLTVYAVRHELTSPQWARAFAKGCNARIDLEGEQLQAGNLAMFGSPDRWELLQRARSEGRTWYYGDHAYFGRREYYRITRNAWQLTDLARDGDVGRWERLGLRIRSKWRDNGRYVLLCPNSPAYFERHGLSVDTWIRETSAAIRLQSDREIRVRFKRSPSDFDFDVRNAWAVVVHTSVAGVLSALQGVPCFATEPCASLAFGCGDLGLIESPARPDNRFEMATVLAANQWTLHEMASGQAWSYLNDRAAAGRDHEDLARLDDARGRSSPAAVDAAGA
jgi:hypothetical protein